MPPGRLIEAQLGRKAIHVRNYRREAWLRSCTWPHCHINITPRYLCVISYIKLLPRDTPRSCAMRCFKVTMNLGKTFTFLCRVQLSLGIVDKVSKDLYKVKTSTDLKLIRFHRLMFVFHGMFQTAMPPATIGIMRRKKPTVPSSPSSLHAHKLLPAILHIFKHAYNIGVHSTLQTFVV